MTIKPIKTDTDHEAALREIECLWGAKVDTPGGDKLAMITITTFYT